MITQTVIAVIAPFEFRPKAW